MKYSKIRFYLSYIYYKIRIPFDVKVGWRNVLLAEIIWLVNIFLKKNFNFPNSIKKEYYETIFGKFYITPDIISIVTVSPAFERLDSDMLKKMIDEELKNKNKVLFIDIGAYFGDYTIGIGNRFRKSKNLDIIAFEPGTEYLSSPTLDQLKKNIKLNKLTSVKVFSYGIGPRIERNTLGIDVKPMHVAIGKSYYTKYSTIFIKLDIDDYVIEGLEGIQRAVENFKNVYLLVEDFVKPKETLRYLKKHNYEFVTKLTPYNSFWMKKNASLY